MDKRTIKIVVGKNGKIPAKQTILSAGYDIYSAEDIEIQPQTRKLVKTEISMEIPEGYYGRLVSRSGLASKKSIDVGAGIIDADYRGDIMVLLINNSNEVFCSKKNERIAQLIICKYLDVNFIKVDKLVQSERGNKGFGSTGK